jgi:Spy/CpxP family protein refolding chaperone
MKTRTFLTCMLGAAALLGATSHEALAGGGGGGGGGGRGGFGGALTPEQNMAMRDALMGSAADMTALNDKLAAAQKDAIKAALDKSATDATVRAKIEAVAKIQTDIAVLRYSKGVKAIASTVTDEQKTTMDTTPGPNYNALFGGGGGGGGRGRRGGAGGGGGGN